MILKVMVSCMTPLSLDRRGKIVPKGAKGRFIKRSSSELIWVKFPQIKHAFQYSAQYFKVTCQVAPGHLSVGEKYLALKADYLFAVKHGGDPQKAEGIRSKLNQLVKDNNRLRKFKLK